MKYFNKTGNVGDIFKINIVLILTKNHGQKTLIKYEVICNQQIGPDWQHINQPLKKISILKRGWFCTANQAQFVDYKSLHDNVYAP